MKISVELQPWQTPNFVRAVQPPRPRQEGVVFGTQTWPLAEVDPWVLARMCDAFRADVFRKAGKEDPA